MAQTSIIQKAFMVSYNHPITLEEKEEIEQLINSGTPEQAMDYMLDDPARRLAPLAIQLCFLYCAAGQGTELQEAIQNSPKIIPDEKAIMCQLIDQYVQWKLINEQISALGNRYKSETVVNEPNRVELG